VKAVNLIPTDQRVSIKTSTVSAAAPPTGGGALGAYVILGVLVFAIAASALYVLSTNAIKDNRAELARVSLQADTLQRQASSLQAFADFKTLSESRVATVRGLAASRFAWQRTLGDISRVLPADVYISSLDGSTSSAAGGSSSLRGAITAPSIELAGCTTSQASVARLMSRLRDVRGVTRVSLSKSDAPESAVTAPALPPTLPANGDKAPATTAEPCPKGSPPAFDMVIFFERASIGQDAAPNAAAGPAGVSTGAAGATGPASSTSGPTGATGAAPSPTTSTTP